MRDTIPNSRHGGPRGLDHYRLFGTGDTAAIEIGRVDRGTDPSLESVAYSDVAQYD
jgi:hypothetical protein